MMHKVIGIDLGTTYSAVAAYDPDELTSVVLADNTIPDENKSRITPSVIGLDRTGKAPKKRRTLAPSASPLGLTPRW